MWVLNILLTVVAAVSYGELSAMFPKAKVYVTAYASGGFVWLPFHQTGIAAVSCFL
jgi:uncharacterized membrane protein YagU involved in acid resistance